MTDYSELKRLAEAASQPEDGYPIRMALKVASFFSLATPAAVLALIAENEDARRTGAFWKDENICADSVIDQLKAENEALRKGRTDWQAECLKRGFEYVREPDDHYVLADLPEMADLLGMLLGVEVRTKDNDAYEEANSRLNEQIEGLINTIHAQESMRKDADRYRWLRNEADFSDFEALCHTAIDEWAAYIDGCETCQGSGEIDQSLGGEWNSGVVPCPDCDGRGR